LAENMYLNVQMNLAVQSAITNFLCYRFHMNGLSGYSVYLLGLHHRSRSSSRHVILAHTTLNLDVITTNTNVAS
jgi:hypothetical protein